MAAAIMVMVMGLVVAAVVVVLMMVTVEVMMEPRGCGHELYVGLTGFKHRCQV
jgi:hypothetical protein